MHVTNTDIGIRIPVPCNGDEPRRRIDAGALGASSTRQLHGQTRATRHVDQTIPVAHAKTVVHGHVFAAIAGFAQRGESTALRPQPSSTTVQSFRLLAVVIVLILLSPAAGHAGCASA